MGDNCGEATDRPNVSSLMFHRENVVYTSKSVELFFRDLFRPKGTQQRMSRLDILMDAARWNSLTRSLTQVLKEIRYLKGKLKKKKTEHGLKALFLLTPEGRWRRRRRRRIHHKRRPTHVEMDRQAFYIRLTFFPEHHRRRNGPEMAKFSPRD